MFAAECSDKSIGKQLDDKLGNKNRAQSCTGGLYWYRCIFPGKQRHSRKSLLTVLANL